MDGYIFSDGVYEFWQQQYAYNRRSNVIRCKQNQAPMSRIAEIDPLKKGINDDTWQSFTPATRDEVKRWLDRFGQKYGYTGRMWADLTEGQQLVIFPENLSL